MKVSNKNSLSNQIAGILDSAPTSVNAVDGESDSSKGGSLENDENLSDDEATAEESPYDEETDDEDEDNEDSDESEDKNAELSANSEDDSNFQLLSQTNVSKQVNKGLSVRNQMAMWENLLEVRIQLQKCLLTTNKMPQPATFAEIKNESGSEFSNKINETKTTLCGTLDKLLLLQKLVEKQFPETKNLRHQTVTKNDSDEEIPSDTENEQSANEEDDAPLVLHEGKKRKLEEYETEISEHHKRYKDYRNGVIQKWNDKTRVAVKGGSSSHSILDQIEYNLSNKDKLIKRTQMRRSQYTIIGEEANDEKIDDEHNAEIFDDDDFYHQLLRELIEVKAADVTDPVQLGRQWIQLQSLRSKMKRKIDTKATKGRKIRYAVHSKLVNFMAPIDENLYTDEAKNELYSSLFGKNQAVFNV